MTFLPPEPTSRCEPSGPDYLASFLTKVAVTVELRNTVTSVVALPVPTVTAPDHSLKTKLAAGKATSVTATFVKKDAK